MDLSINRNGDEDEDELLFSTPRGLYPLAVLFFTVVVFGLF